MRPLFTVHAGEYIVGSYIEKNFKDLNVWVPSKDVGIDLLITDSKNRNNVSLQVKFSKDFSEIGKIDVLAKSSISRGWWTLNRDKIEKSPADFWVFVLQSMNQKIVQYVIIEPQELLSKLLILRGDQKSFHSYLCVTQRDKYHEPKCWETRGLRKEEKRLITEHKYDNDYRDFTKYLNNWESLRRKVIK